MALKTLDFVVRDADGEDHQYTIKQLPGEAGIDTFFEIGTTVGKSVGYLIDAVMGERGQSRQDRPWVQPRPPDPDAGDGSRDDPDDPDRDLDDAGEDILDAPIDGVRIGQAIDELAHKVIKAGGSKLVKRFLDRSIRDGKLFSPMAVAPSEKHWVVNEAYAGNYLEMALVMAEILQFNYRNLFGGLSVGWLTALKKRTATRG